MRLAVLSDIHGSLPALEAVLADAQQQGIDGIVDAGDAAGGPCGLEVIRLLRSLGTWMIRGNNEEYLLAYDAGEIHEAWRTSKQWAFTRWTYHSLDRETLDFIASLPEQRVVALSGCDPIRVVHGSPRSSREHLYPDGDSDAMRAFAEARMLPDGKPTPLAVDIAEVREPVLVCGHSHISWVQEAGGRLVVNPGSVGGSNNGDARAQYALLTWEGGRWQAELRAVAHDLNRVRAAYEESGLLEAGGAFARACLRGDETGMNVPWFFVLHALEVAREAGVEARDVIPDDVWDRAAETFDWERW